MANQKATFAKRQREQSRNEKARAKQERLAARRAASTGEKGPPIDWSALVDSTAEPTTDEPAPENAPEAAPSDTSSDDSA